MKRIKALFNLGMFSFFGRLYAFGGFPMQPIVNACKILNQTELVKSYADKITHGCTSKADKARAIFNWLRTNVIWVDDWAEYHIWDYWATPDQILKILKTDCEGFMALNYALLRASGFEISETKASGVSQHLFCQCFIEGEWFMSDAAKHTFLPARLTNLNIFVEWNENGVI